MTQLQQDPKTSTEGWPRFWLRRPELVVFLMVIFAPPTLAWVDYLLFGLPTTSGNADPADPRGPHDFPAWLRGWHYLNLLLFVLLTRTGWRIFQRHPRLYWSEPAKPGAEWFRLDPPADASTGSTEVRDEEGPIRHRHALLATGWALASFVDLALVVLTGRGQHLVPMSWRVVPEAFRVFVRYSTFHLPLDPDGFYRYNSLQLLSYSIAMFGFVPLMILTGLAISPEGGDRFSRLSRLFGNRQAARSIHYLTIVGYVAFIAVHVFFVVLYAFRLNLDHIVLGTDETGLPGWVIGGAGISLIALIAYATRRMTRNHPI